MSEHVISKMGNFEETRKHTHNQPVPREISFRICSYTWCSEDRGQGSTVAEEERGASTEEREVSQLDLMDGQDDTVWETSTWA